MNWFEKHILKNRHVLVIAEAGVNHNGNFDQAVQLVKKAKESGADCVKFQTFTYESSESKNSTMPGYFKGRLRCRSKKEFYDSIQFTREQFKELKACCRETGIEFLSTACDIDGLAILAEIKSEAIKIASADMNNDYLLSALGETGIPAIFSTAMSTIPEIRHGIETYLSYGGKQFALMQCTAQYPTPYTDLNMRAMETLRGEFKCPVGFSDHSEGIYICVAAAALGAAMVEKHFTLSRNLPGVDQPASIEPQELVEMVKGIRQVEVGLGSRDKKVQPAELDNAKHMRRSLMAGCDIKAGTIISRKHIAAKRPGIGIPPCMMDQLIGRELLVDLEKEDLFNLKTLKRR
ncbi:MAG: N-acetylneuraminate synthase family protein [Victivallales bacterium]